LQPDFHLNGFQIHHKSRPHKPWKRLDGSNPHGSLGLFGDALGQEIFRRLVSKQGIFESAEEREAPAIAAEALKYGDVEIDWEFATKGVTRCGGRQGSRKIVCKSGDEPPSSCEICGKVWWQTG